MQPSPLDKQRRQVSTFANATLRYPATKIALNIGKLGIFGFAKTYTKQLRLEIWSYVFMINEET